MATFFSISNGNFTDAGVFGKTLSAGDKTSGTAGFLLTTTYSYCPVLTSDGSSYTGIGLHLSARNASPAGTLDVQLSASNGSITNMSYPVSSFTGYNGSNNGTSTYPQNWQLVSFVAPVTLANNIKMTVGLRTTTPGQVSLIGTSSDFDKYIVTTTSTTPAAGDTIHISSSMLRLGPTPITVTYNNTNTGYFRNISIHNGGTLTFSNATSTTLNVSGSNGLQVTSQGTLNVGTQASPIPSNVTHTINLNGANVNVHTGGNLNMCGANKAQFSYLASDTTTSTRVFSTSNNISSWVAGDTVVVAPASNAAVNSFDTLVLSAVDNANTFRSNAVPSFSHSSIPHVPTVMNMSRNIKVKGVGTSGFIRFTDAAQVNIANTEFSNITNSSQMFVMATNALSNVLLSSCAVSGNAANIVPIKLATGYTTYRNLTANNNNFYNIGTANYALFSSTSASNVDMRNNVSMGGYGFSTQSLTATNCNFSDNWGIGTTDHGIYILDSLFYQGSIGGFGYRNSGTGTAIAGTNVVGSFNGIGGFYNFNEGCNISGNISNLGSVTFSNISASNNTTAGVSISGNSTSLTSPITLNVNGVVANNNGGAGFEGYSITGNLSSMTLNNNYAYGIKTSIGNAATVFDGITSMMASVTSSSACFGILSGVNYFPTVIKNAYLTKSSSTSFSGAAIMLDSSKFEQFTVESSTLSSDTFDIRTLSNRNYIEGSYQFNNCTFGTGILSSTLANYQPEIFLETGFAAMKVGGVSTNHFRWTPAGKISSDIVRYYGTNGISEKLEPISATKKLRCGSKLIPVNSGDTHTVSVYVYSTGPTPRLMLKKNSSLGYSDTVLATTATTGSWVLLTGSIPAAASAGIFEVYVDCSGTSGSVNVDNWTLI